MSKNRAWLMIAFTLSGWNGLVMRNVGSGRVQDLVDGIEPGAPVRQQDVRQDQARTRAPDGLDGLPLGAGDLDHAMPQRRHQPLQIERDQGLILDDDHIGGDLPGDFAPRLVHQALQLGPIDIHDRRCVLRRELLDRNEQERLARSGGQHLQVALGRLETRRRGSTRSLVVPLDRAQDLQERSVEGDAGRQHP